MDSRVLHGMSIQSFSVKSINFFSHVVISYHLEGCLESPGYFSLRMPRRRNTIILKLDTPYSAPWTLIESKLNPRSRGSITLMAVALPCCETFTVVKIRMEHSWQDQTQYTFRLFELFYQHRRQMLGHLECFNSVINRSNSFE